MYLCPAHGELVQAVQYRGHAVLFTAELNGRPRYRGLTRGLGFWQQNVFI